MWRSFQNSLVCGSLPDVEDDTIGVPHVATREGWVLFQDGAAGGHEFAFGGLNVGHEELKDRAVVFTFFDVETESAGLEAHERFAPVRDWQAQNRFIKLRGLCPSLGSYDDIS
jgi:hypothetical protein